MMSFVDELIMIVGLDINFLGWLPDRWDKLFIFFQTLEFFFFFCLFLRAAPAAYGGSQARGLIGVVTAGLRLSHSTSGFKPHL